MQALTVHRSHQLSITLALAIVALTISSVTAAQTPGEINLHTCVIAANESQRDRDEGRLLEARKKMVLCASDACPANLRRDCREWLADVDARLPTIVVRVVDEQERDRTDATLRLDGATIALDGRAVALDPGQHWLEVEADGAEPQRQVLLAAEREIARVVHIRLQPTAASASPRISPEPARVELTAPAPTPESSFRVPTAAWILGGAGVAALGSFTILGLSAINTRDALAARCGNLCSEDDVQSGRTQALVADISLGVGIAALAGGVLWTWLAQGTPERPVALSASAEISSRHVMGNVQGRF